MPEQTSDTTSTTQQQAQNGAAGAGQQTQQGSEKTSTQAADKGAQATQTQTMAELEITFPEGAKTYEERVGKFKALAKEHGFSSKQAQALVDFNLAAHKEDADRQSKAWEQQKTAWVDELKADKDFGGANYQKNLDAANKVIRQFGGDAAVKTFADTGAGFHPVIVKTFAAIGKAIADDKLDIGAPNGAGDESREAELRAMFPNSYDQMTQKPA